ncbi:putative membrane protein YdjX (TVP38/TMEM64 family) [Limnobacter thiooxidans]|uniref:TVP38/TMEM64 family membrane protein n=1 Tax=Limnobacter thiooxidans TaxID=131080 RepID=A0AA86J053_9BURK|nr:VTT domain-containing protein [Limnobacter sp.]MCZ8014852.1 VTT domain-containing protein [Limnobacter sp.]RZS40504.1 putative membrane protein YdjX (TVP38/TMEM64 family) [Limnobacter thiooxidans]BET27062.1 TVP38/TMEM64 family protein [Limnobacter thiooxidans]
MPVTLLKHWKKSALLLVAALFLWVWLSMDVSLQDMLMAQRELAMHFMEHPTLVTLIYFSLFVVITALCLPGAGVLMLVGGGCMGFGLCIVVSTAASALGALLTFLAARFLFRESVEQRFAAKLLEINRGIEKNEVVYLLSLRLAPIIPFVAFNLLAGLTRVKPWTFLWTSFLGMLPGTVLYVNAGHELSKVSQLGELISTEVVVSLTALALVPFLIQWAAKQIQQRKTA